MVGPRVGLGPHMPFKRTTLQQGDTIYLEFTGTYNRYNAPSMRSAVIGQPSDGVRQLADCALDVLDRLIDGIRPGRTGHEVATEAARGLREPVRTGSGSTTATGTASARACSRPGASPRCTSRRAKSANYAPG